MTQKDQEIILNDNDEDRKNSVSETQGNRHREMKIAKWQTMKRK